MKEKIGQRISETRIVKYINRKNREDSMAYQSRIKSLEIESRNAAIIREREELDRLAQSALDDMVTLD